MSTDLGVPSQFKVVGIILAVLSGALIGSSFVFKKKGLLASQAGNLGEGVAYLKSPMWWTGMTLMILGELCNFAAYAFVDAIVVTPLGALSVVICAILSAWFLPGEGLTFFGWIGCGLCILGSVIIALNGPKEQSVSTIVEFQKLFLSVGFLIFGSLVILSALVLIFFFAPRYGKKNMLWYIMICSLFGGLSVSCTQGLGSSIVTSIRGDNQFKHWFIYFLLVFVVVTLLTEIYYLNMALALFNTAMVTPTYYVIFTFMTLVTSVILYQGLHASVVQIITIVMGFLVICAGITILQMSKVDPTSLGGLDRKSTILLQAARRPTEGTEKNDITSIEEPGMDAIRGSMGAIGSIIRARSMRQSMSTNSGGSIFRQRRNGMGDEEARLGHGLGDGSTDSTATILSTRGLANLPRHQLYDTPMPRTPQQTSIPLEGGPSRFSQSSTDSPHHNQTIRFDDAEVAHYYPTAGKSGAAVHEQRPIPLSSSSFADVSVYPVSPVTPRQSSSHPLRLDTIATPTQRTIMEESPIEDEGLLSRDYALEPPPPQEERFRKVSLSQSPRTHAAQSRQASDPFKDLTPTSSRGASRPDLLVEQSEGSDSDDDRREHVYMSSISDGHDRRISGASFASLDEGTLGGMTSSDEEREARESLVGDGHTGIRLISKHANASPARRR